MSDVAVVGAGAVGLTLAARLAQHGVSVDLFEAEPRRERFGSKAICMQRETLEIWARLGIGQAVADRGIQWNVGRTYFRGRQLFEVHLPGDDEHFPPFVNISQSEVEELLEARATSLGVRIHRGHRFTALTQDAEGVDGDLRDRCRTGDASVRLPRRHRWRPFDRPPRRRHRLRRVQLRRPLPHQRCPRGASLHARAPLPPGPAVEPRPPGAHPSPARRGVADRLAGPARDRCRCRARERRPRSAHP